MKSENLILSVADMRGDPSVLCGVFGTVAGAGAGAGAAATTCLSGSGADVVNAWLQQNAMHSGY